MFSGFTFRRKSKNNPCYIFFSSFAGCWTVNFIFWTVSHNTLPLLSRLLLRYYSNSSTPPVSINPAVTAAEAGGGAEAAGGARPAGGADGAADRGGQTENQSWRAEGWAGDSEKETSCQHQGSDETTNTRLGNNFTPQSIAPSWYSTQLNVTISLADKEDYTFLWEPCGKVDTVCKIEFHFNVIFIFNIEWLDWETVRTED